MRKLIITMFFLTSLTAVSTAFTGHNCPPDAMCGDYIEKPTSDNITDNLSLEEPEVELTQISSSCSSAENDSVSWGDYHKMESNPPQHRLEFNGTVISSTSCQELDYTVSREGGVYNINIQARDKEGICVQCIGAVKYEISFGATADYFQLNVAHEGELVKSFAPPQEINESKPLEEPDQNTKVRKGYLAGILERLQSLF